MRSPSPRLRASLLSATLALLAGCAPPAENDARPTVVVTIFPVADLVAAVAGPEVRVEALLPPRASPATWEATPGQVRAVSTAVGYVRVGGGLDAWLDEFPAPGATLTLTEGMELREADHDHGGPHGHGESGDPHVWLDPILVRDELVPRIQAFLTDLFPARAEDLRQRAQALEDTLTRLDLEIRSTLRDPERRSFVATHEAWSYFAARYDLDPLGSVYERPGHEPSVKGLAELVRAAKEHGVERILAEPQLASGGAQALAAEMGASVGVVDPLGGPGVQGRESYPNMMRANAAEFARALGAS